MLRTTTRLSALVTLLAVMAWALLPASSFADVITWTGAVDGTWDTTTANWTADAGGRNDGLYLDGDTITFDDSGALFAISLGATFSPASMTVSNSANPYSFTGGNISGVSNLLKSGTALATFAQGSLSFPSGTQVTGSGDIQYDATGAGPHSFGTGNIELNSSGAEFIYNPAVAPSTLTNNFVVNANNARWNSPADLTNTQSGTVTLNANLDLGVFPIANTLLREDVILTDDRTVSGGNFQVNPTISGQVTSSGAGAPHDLTIGNVFGSINAGWFFKLSSPTVGGWDVKNIVYDTTVGAQQGTLIIDDDERDFFDTPTANGGYFIVRNSGVLFDRVGSGTAEIGFRMILNAQPGEGFSNYGTGIRTNTGLDVVSGGELHGTGAYRSGATGGTWINAGSSTNPRPFDAPLDITVSGTGLISPGDPLAVDTVDILTINGDVVFNGGTVVIEVTGSGGVAGVDFDQLVIADSDNPSGSGNLTGLSNATLEVNINGVTFDQLTGQTIDIILAENDLSALSFGSVTGSFNGIDFDVVYGVGVVQLTNFQLHVPEPGSLTLLGVAGCLVALRRRRRRHAGRC